MVYTKILIKNLGGFNTIQKPPLKSHGEINMNEFENKKWKDISNQDKVELLKNAICRDLRMGTPLLDGEGMVDFYETFAARGQVSNGVIEIDDDEVLYNPCIGNDGQSMSQEELGTMFEKYESSISV